MSPFAIQITNGCLISDIEDEDIEIFKKLQDINAIEQRDGLWRLRSIYRAGEFYLGKDGRGFVEAQFKEQRDLLIEPDNIGDAQPQDTVVAKRIIARRGRASGKVSLVITKAHPYTIAYTHRDESGNFEIRNIKTALPTHATMRGMDLKAFKIGTLLKVDNESDEVLEVLGHLDDPRVDEKISLALYHRADEFPKDCIEQAIRVESTVDRSQHQERVDLTHLDFCTIDPVTAKDFDDAIYFDMQSYTLFVAIADVSHYVEYFSPIDKEAKKRGFTTYLPHKSFPMLPRELSENICSLKPKVDRLAFVAKIELDRESLKPIKEEFFEAIIHSKRRFNYDQIDHIISTNGTETTGIDRDIIRYLLPLQKITQQLRDRRLKSGFDFRSEEVRLSIDSDHLLKSTNIETGTPSHSLIEECMLLANQASAKRFITNGEDREYGIFRIHEPPQLAKLEALLEELAAIGLFVQSYEDSPSLIRAIQSEATKMGLESEVDAMIIKSLRQASYSASNIGHFGLGFSHYSHFTSPIRRYSDLILHRLIKAQLNSDEDEMGYLLRNIEPLCARVSELERESTKAEWDFRDRKFARWAKENIGLFFEAEVIEAGESAKATLLGDIKGVTLHIKGDDILLFERVRVMITEVDIATATIMGEVVPNV
ncbi:3'-to-5' exoribonuclease RNase R [hydrothermal vent metagenome]|uniref:3'-to-5' exoribonuclease RNase R n=1 Tax=hydrothermal vent metagenome TaxID=652676 RepID=A0A1W1BS83_9ZZZZ